MLLFPRQPSKNALRHFSLLFHFSNSQTMQCMEMKLCTHVYFSASMTTIDKKLSQALFPVTTSSLLKLAHHTMHGGETCTHVYFTVSITTMNKTLPQALFLITTSSLLNHSGEICTQVYLCVSMMSPSLRHSISIHTIGIL